MYAGGASGVCTTSNGYKIGTAATFSGCLAPGDQVSGITASGTTVSAFATGACGVA